jgi:hypothetical protein
LRPTGRHLGEEHGCAIDVTTSNLPAKITINGTDVDLFQHL